MPAVVAGHRNAALNKKLAQGEANFSCSYESNFHRITLLSFRQVTRCFSVPQRRSSREFAGTVSNSSEYHPLGSGAEKTAGQTNADIVTFDTKDVKDYF
ncbi:MAG: hypothetical protein PUH00_06680 [Clostridiales bacterium]|uniref:hypothetical protein n=1 Tax=Evtepia sp. TaxID=2773933 RepID=UPI002985064F|nr:hypothetical protein [Evtepia sp.]MDD7289385.1 hypothetical protein [Clostridiales bacterium]